MFHTSIGPLHFQQAVGQVPVSPVVAVLPLSFWPVGGMGLAAIGIHLPGRLGSFRYKVSLVVVGVEIMPQNPAAVVAFGGQLRHLVSGVVGLVSADAVRQVHCHGTV